MDQCFETQRIVPSDVADGAMPADYDGLAHVPTLSDMLRDVMDDPAASGGGLPNEGQGDDIVDVTAMTTGYGTLDGGAGTDTLRLNPASPQTTANGPFGSYQLSVGVFNTGTTLSSFERFVFNSTAGNTMSAQFAYGGNNNALNQIGPGLAANSEIVGGAGSDTLTLIYASANQPGTVTAPSGFTYTNWTTPTRAYLPGDRVQVVVTGTGATTIYGSAHSGVQMLSGGTGSDTIYGSDDMDYISAGSGADQLHGGGGNDALALINTYAYSGGAGPESTRTGAGVMFDGGAGTDFLVLGGNVNFLGTLQSIEGLYLQPAYLNTNSPSQPIFVGSQYLTVATFASSTFAALPSNLEIDGQGVIVINMGNGGEAFSTANYIFDAGAVVGFQVNGGNGDDQITGGDFGNEFYGGLGNDMLTGGTGDDGLYGGGGNDVIMGGNGDDDIDGDVGNDTLSGGDGSDTLSGYFGNDILTGGAGADEFRPGLGTDVIVDFTKGDDLINVYDLGITSFAQFAAHTTQVGADLVFTVRIDEFTFSTLTIKNTTLAQLDASDFNFANPIGWSLYGSDGDDLLYGLGGEFTITNGAGGNDMIVSGPGLDRRINGGDGNDTVILSDRVTSGFFMGDTGFDTLALRARGATSVNGTTYNFSSFTGPTASSIGLVGFEALKLESTANTVFDVNIDLLTYQTSIATLIGGAGTDIVTTRGYNDLFPTLSFVNWSDDDTVVFLGSTYFPTMNITGAHPGLYRLVGSTAADTITAGASRDQLEGGDGNDTLNGGGGIDTLLGGAGNDRLIVGASGNGTIVDGGADNDTLVVSGSVSLGGLSNIETIELQNGANLTLTDSQFNGLVLGTVLSATGTITVNMAPDQFLLGSTLAVAAGSAISVVFNGSSGNDYVKAVTQATNTMLGGDGNDFLRGGQLADVIDGGAGNDKITGFGGADMLTGGGGADQFRYLAQSDSGLGATADHITDFQVGTDRLNFQLFDGDTNTPDLQNPGFSFLGGSAFHGNGAAEIRYEASGADMLVQVDVNGDGVADMAIYLNGLGGGVLTSADFML